MSWGRLPASHLSVVAEALGEKPLHFVSIGRLTLIWEPNPPTAEPTNPDPQPTTEDA